MTELDELSNETIDLLDKHQVLKPLIIKTLVKDKLQHIKITSKDTQFAKQTIINEAKLSNEANYKDWLEKQIQSENTLLETYSEASRIQKYCLEKYAHLAESRFLKRKDELDQVTYSLLRVKDQYLANELYLRLTNNEASFSDLAKEFSTGPEKNSNGKVGPVAIKSSHPILASRLQNFKIGEINQPLNIEGLWIIVRVESFVKAILDEKMQLLMSQEIFSEWLEKATTEKYEKFVSRVKEDNKFKGQ